MFIAGKSVLVSGPGWSVFRPAPVTFQLYYSLTGRRETERERETGPEW